MGLFGRGRDKDLKPASVIGEVAKAHLGNCYEYAARFALANDDEPWSVVHGTIKTELARNTGIFTTPLDHAFCVWEEESLAYEPSTDTVYDLDAFLHLFNATLDEVYGEGRGGWRAKCVEYSHFGPWDGSCPPTETLDEDDWDEDEDF